MNNAHSFCVTCKYHLQWLFGFVLSICLCWFRLVVLLHCMGLSVNVSWSILLVPRNYSHGLTKGQFVSGAFSKNVVPILEEDNKPLILHFLSPPIKSNPVYDVQLHTFNPDILITCSDDSVYCLNGATCSDLETGFFCICPAEYTGLFCETGGKFIHITIMHALIKVCSF